MANNKLIYGRIKCFLSFLYAIRLEELKFCGIYLGAFLKRKVHFILYKISYETVAYCNITKYYVLICHAFQYQPSIMVNIFGKFYEGKLKLAGFPSEISFVVTIVIAIVDLI